MFTIPNIDLLLKFLLHLVAGIYATQQGAGIRTMLAGEGELAFAHDGVYQYLYLAASRTI
jgi:hypothetical protein